MYCRECGQEIFDGAAFCENCGTPVDELMKSPPPTPVLNQWYCVLDGKSPSGPYSDEQINDMVSNKLIQNNTPVWHKGLEDWTEFSKVRESKYYDDRVPSLKKEHINGSWMWTLAFAPLLSSSVFYTYQYYTYLNLANDVSNAELYQTELDLFRFSWIITLSINSFLTYQDCKMLKKCGYDTRQLGSYLIIPAYMYKRARMLNQSQVCLVIWIVTFAIDVLFF